MRLSPFFCCHLTAKNRNSYFLKSPVVIFAEYPLIGNAGLSTFQGKNFTFQLCT